MNRLPQRLRHIVLMAAASLAVAATFAGAANAYTENYGSGYYYDGVKTYAPSVTTWNYNQGYSFQYLNDICAYISTYSDGNGAIYGSGCAPGTSYSMCHATVVHNYYAFIEHFNDNASIELFGMAQYPTCGAAAAALSPTSPVATTTPSNMAVFSRPASSADQAPADVQALAASNNAGITSPGINPAEARRVGGGPAIYALPANTGLCAAFEIPGGNATSMACTDHAHASVISAVTSTPQGYTVWGTASDAVRGIHVILPNGQTSTIPVTSNGFSASFAVKPVSVRAE